MRSIGVVASSGLSYWGPMAERLHHVLLDLDVRHPYERFIVRARYHGGLGGSYLEQRIFEIYDGADRVRAIAPKGTDRGEVYRRDYSLVERSDRLLAFFDEDRLMEGGTGHVVHAALLYGKPVTVYTIGEDGCRWIATDDGYEAGPGYSQLDLALEAGWSSWVERHVGSVGIPLDEAIWESLNGPTQGRP